MRKNLFSGLQPTPTEHFRMFFYAAVLSLFHHVTQIAGSNEAAFEQFPFLVGYNNELAEGGLAGVNPIEALDWWLDSLQSWEEKANQHLPLRAVREAAGLDHSTMTLLVGVGLIEEDRRFGLVFESLQDLPGQHRPTSSLLNGWWQENGGLDPRAAVGRLRELGLLRVVNPDAPRLDWAFEVPSALWDALRGEEHESPAPWLRYRSLAQLPLLDELILPSALHAQVRLLPELLASGKVEALIVHGARRNGRRTLLRAIARALGHGSLEITGLTKVDDERWHLIGPLATALNALPVAVFDLALEEAVELPRLTAYNGASGIVLSKQGGVSGAGLDRALTVNLEMPDAKLRRRHWQRVCGEDSLSELDRISERFRLTGGNISRAAGLAQSYAALRGRAGITLIDAQQATRALNRQILDTLAVRLQSLGDWNQLAVGDQTRQELQALESRCRYREQLCDVAGTQLNPGVRALFSGPSGTGKTLAARLLASVLQMDLYRLDLSAVVNKYIGETEKNLNQVFSRAEELDVILLLDEGDALLTQRTGVQSSNDRYANLETNYLLQRVESFEGILIVTTNAGDRIDTAFQRRMDVVISFPSPDALGRWAIWQLHLPLDHAVDPLFLEEVAGRCTLNGGQIRNAALQASLLALDDGGIVTSAQLETSIQREYRKVGAVCPLRGI
jgi:hypothetical protein